MRIVASTMSPPLFTSATMRSALYWRYRLIAGVSAGQIRGRLAMIEVSGSNGHLRIDGEALIIDHKRPGLLTLLGMGIQGERRILLRDITSVQLAKANLITNGYIRFTFHGGSDRPYGIAEAASDPNCVIFGWSANRLFESFKIAIEKAI